MGFNTVAMFLNDHFSSIEKSPESVIYGLCHPPMGDQELRDRRWYNEIGDYARSKGEGYPGFGNGINILPTFHADDVHFLYAGRNTIERLKVHRYHDTAVTEYRPKPGGGSEAVSVRANVVTLILPNWWEPR